MLSSKQSAAAKVHCDSGAVASALHQKQHQHQEDEEQCDALPKERSTTALVMRRAMMIVLCFLCLFPLVACLALTRITTSPTTSVESHHHTTPHSSSSLVTWSSRTGRDVSSTVMVTAASSNASITLHDVTNTTAEDRTVVTESPSTTSTQKKESVMIANVYFANDTLVGKPIPCTDAEKECLGFNRLLFPADGRCYALGDGPSRCHFAVDRCELQNRSGHVRGTCVPTDLCPSTPNKQVRLAFDGRCVKLRQLRHFCGKGPVDLVPHFFGDFECSAVRLGLGLDLDATSPTVAIPQPPESGRCVFPNLRHDVTSVSEQERRVWVGACSEEQSRCFASNTVWCDDVHCCCNLLRQNHCPDGQWVALNRTAWGEGGTVTGCVEVNRCPTPDQRLMAFDNRCHHKDEVLRALCPNGVLLPNAFGEMACVTRDFYKHVIRLRSVRPGLCEVAHRLSHDGDEPGVRLTPECGLTGFDNCVDAF